MASESKNNKKDKDDLVEELVARLEEDHSGNAPSVPKDALFAMRSEDVKKAFAKRLDAGESLMSIEPLMPDIVLGLRRVLMRFSKNNLPTYLHDGILVQLNVDGSVADIIEHFRLNDEIATEATPKIDGTFPMMFDSPVIVDESEATRSKTESDKRLAQFVSRARLSPVFGYGFGFTIGGSVLWPGTVLGAVTWSDVSTATLNGQGRSDTQTDQRGTQDP